LANIETNKSKLIRTYFYAVFLVLFGCRETQFNYNCGIAPTNPTELVISNDTNQEVEVIMSVKEDELNEFEKLSLSPNESITLCIEYEGPITDRIHIKFENQTTIIKLRHQQSNEFTLKERSLK
jgi:hypothetical protein